MERFGKMELLEKVMRHPNIDVVDREESSREMQPEPRLFDETPLGALYNGEVGSQAMFEGGKR